MPNNTVEVRVALPNERSQILEIMYTNFDKDEPLIKNLLPSSKDCNSDSMEFMNDDPLDSTLVAVKDGTIVGIAINSILELGNENKMYTDVENYNDVNVRDAMAIIHPFLDYVATQFKISSYCLDSGKGILLDKLYVDQSHRGRGIAKKLIEGTSEFGRQNDCKFIKVIATSYFTCLALERLGFTQIFTINYKDYKVNGEVIFKTDPPHISLGVYLKNI